MSHPAPQNDYEQSIIDNIREYGWHCTSVGGDEDSPAFSYSIGLWESFGHPELVIFGLDTKLAHGMLSKVARAAEAGEPFEQGKSNDRLLENYSCIFLAVSPQRYEGHVVSACWYYQNEEIPTYQIVWPSLEGHFPWHPDASAELRLSQPILADYAGDA